MESEQAGITVFFSISIILIVISFFIGYSQAIADNDNALTLWKSLDESCGDKQAYIINKETFDTDLIIETGCK